jgi:hypothetical protein
MSPLASWFLLVSVMSVSIIATLLWHIADLKRELDEWENPF